MVTARRSTKPNDSNGLEFGSRIGITVGRKVGSAVVRNRFKRRLREWFRTARHEFPTDVDLVVIARPSGGRLELAELDARLRDLLDLSPAANAGGVHG